MLKRIQVEDALCTGCGVCEKLCEVHAIKMSLKTDGFMYPEIDVQKCINCGICAKGCAIEQSFSRLNEVENCYASYASDEIRERSSSGGVFTLLAEWIIEQNGYVCGAAYLDRKVKHIIVNNKEELERLRTSKYVQSDIRDVLLEIKRLLVEDKIVLFTGTPCQVAAVYCFLGDAHSKLYTMDILCHGVPSQELFDKYLTERFGEKKLTKINFRDKSAGWTYQLQLKIETEEESIISKISEDPYYIAFNERISLRESCGTCRFASQNRCGDITVGDFWEIWQYKKSLDDRKGTSLVLINSEKGKCIWNSIKEKMLQVQEVPLEYAKRGNVTLNKALSLHPKRNEFLKDLHEYSIEVALNKNRKL